jgi:protein-disulfide isomerase
VFKNPVDYICALGLISFFISMILAGVSIFEIKKVCILCVFTYLLNLLIALVAMNYTTGFVESFKISIKDFIEALKVKQYLISFVLLVLLAIGALFYTTTSYCFTPQVKFYDTLVKYAQMQTNPYKTVGNTLGDENAKIIAYIYTDYRCPICKTYNIITHKAAKELSGFKMVHRNLPLDMECNPNVKMPFHVGSCMLAKYAIASEKQGHFWDMNSAFFEKQPKDEAAILKLASSMGLNADQLKQDANSPQTAERLKSEIQQATALKINGTPTIVINGKLYIGIKPYYDLKNILLKVGAVERKQ